MRRLLLALAALPLASAHCRGLDRAALIKLYEMTGGAHWRNNQNWNVTSGTALENKNNDPCDLKKRWYGVGFTDPCEPLLDNIIGQGPDADYLTELRGAGMVQVTHIPTDQNPADLFTKILGRQPFEKHRKVVLNLPGGAP